MWKNLTPRLILLQCTLSTMCPTVDAIEHDFEAASFLQSCSPALLTTRYLDRRLDSTQARRFALNCCWCAVSCQELSDIPWLQVCAGARRSGWAPCERVCTNCQTDEVLLQVYLHNLLSEGPRRLINQSLVAIHWSGKLAAVSDARMRTVSI